MQGRDVYLAGRGYLAVPIERPRFDYECASTQDRFLAAAHEAKQSAGRIAELNRGPRYARRERLYVNVAVPVEERDMFYELRSEERRLAPNVGTELTKLRRSEERRPVGDHGAFYVK